MNRKVSLGVAIALVILAIAVTISATMMLSMKHFSSLVSDVGQRQAMYDYVDEIDSLSRRQYTIDEERLRAAVAKGYIDGLDDPYAEYLSAAEYSAVQNAALGNRTGFGLELTVSENNQLTICRVDENSPAALAGLTVGDSVTAINDTAVDSAEFASVSSLLDKEGKLSLTVSHNGNATAVELSSNTYTYVSATGYLIADTVGYIRIAAFNNLTALQFKNCYNQLTQQGAQYFVFDVRGNTGGQIAAVTEILGYLLPRGPYAICTKKTETETYTSEDAYELTAPTATLINAQTAGEAELFAAALKDQSKTTLVGSGTEGKAVSQEYFTIDSDQAAVRLSVGEWRLTNSGSNWKNTGLYPDERVDLTEEQRMMSDLLTYEQDTQLQTAVERLQSNYSVTTAVGK